MKIYTFAQRSKEWFDVRCGKFTASDFHTFFGDSIHKQELLFQKAMERMTGRLQGGNIWNQDIQRGIDLEDFARAEYEKITGYKVKTVGFIEYDETCGASPDGLVDCEGGIEFKCPRYENFYRKTEKGYIDPRYITQCQYNMFISGRLWWDFCYFSPGEPLWIKRLFRDNIYIQKIKDTLQRCNKYVDGFIKTFVYSRGMKNIRRWQFMNKQQKDLKFLRLTDVF